MKEKNKQVFPLFITGKETNQRKIFRSIALTTVCMMSIMLILSISVHAEDLNDGTFKYTLMSDGSVKIKGLVDTETVVTNPIIPGMIAGKTVTEIGSDAFKDNNNLKGTLTLPDSLKHIDMSAFQNCSNLTGTLSIPANVIAINDYAFAGCTGFNGQLILPDGLKGIGKETFSGCTSFNGTLTLPKELDNLGSKSFMNCSGFSGELKIPAKTSNVSDAFGGCTGFATLSLSEGVSVIEANAFKDCRFTGTLTFPSTLTSIDSTSFTKGSLNIFVVINMSSTQIPASMFVRTDSDYFVFESRKTVSSTGTLGENIYYRIGDGIIHITSIDLNEHSKSLEVGDSFVLTPKYTPSDASAKVIAWSSNNSTVATVDNNGVVTGIKPGNARITATTIDGNITDFCDITVLDSSTPEPTKYAVTVNNGTGSGSYAPGDTVTITASVPVSGKVFKEWTSSDGVIFANANSATTTFVMLAKAVSVTASYKDAEAAPEPATPADSSTPKDPSKPTDPAEQTKPSDAANSTDQIKTDDSTASKKEEKKAEKIDKKQKNSSISKLKAGKKSITISWKKQTAKGIKGYEIQYSTDKNFKKDAKTVTINKTKTTSKTIKKLKSKKKYYVRIRTYKKSSSEKIYSKWSKTKSVKVK